MATIELTEATFKQVVTGNGIVLVDWWAGWCGPCQRFAPVFEASSEQHADVVHATVDTEAERGLAGVAGITSIPTLMAFRNGVLVFNQSGALPALALENLIESLKTLDREGVQAEITAEERVRGNGSSTAT